MRSRQTLQKWIDDSAVFGLAAGFAWGPLRIVWFGVVTPGSSSYQYAKFSTGETAQDFVGPC
jgi:hypothetical protein